MSQLEGRTVLVTGAARGLGAAIAQECAGQGATVVLTDVLDDQLAETAATIGAAAVTAHLDVTDPESWAAAAEHVRARVGHLDVLVNNAGIIHMSTVAEQDLAAFRTVMDVNVVGVLLGIQTFLQLRTTDGPGSIVNISSVRGLVGGTGLGAYAASKFAVRGLTKVAAIELGELGIRVNAVCPGPIATEMSQGAQMSHLDFEGYVAQLPLRHFGAPSEIASAVAWLASDSSAFVTGIELVVDGGLTATALSPRPRRQD